MPDALNALWPSSPSISAAATWMMGGTTVMSGSSVRAGASSFSLKKEPPYPAAKQS
jgi:hypothetical protein